MSKILTIILNPDPILKKISKKIPLNTIKSKEFQTLLQDMRKTMLKKDGVGLAAPQIGKNIRIFIINFKDKIIFIINPVLSKLSWAKEWGDEGCLSVPDTFGAVRRSKKLICNYINENGDKKNLNANGLLARVIQHENDHLNGILFIDKARNIKKQN